jgi:hypothetical protein
VAAVSGVLLVLSAAVLLGAAAFLGRDAGGEVTVLMRAGLLGLVGAGALVLGVAAFRDFDSRVLSVVGLAVLVGGLIGLGLVALIGRRRAG